MASSFSDVFHAAKRAHSPEGRVEFRYHWEKYFQWKFPPIHRYFEWTPNGCFLCFCQVLMCRCPKHGSVWDSCDYVGPCHDCVDVCRSEYGGRDGSEDDGDHDGLLPPPLEFLQPKPEPQMNPDGEYDRSQQIPLENLQPKPKPKPKPAMNPNDEHDHSQQLPPETLPPKPKPKPAMNPNERGSDDIPWADEPSYFDLRDGGNNGGYHRLPTSTSEWVEQLSPDDPELAGASPPASSPIVETLDGSDSLMTSQPESEASGCSWMGGPINRLSSLSHTIEEPSQIIQEKPKKRKRPHNFHPRLVEFAVTTKTIVARRVIGPTQAAARKATGQAKKKEPVNLLRRKAAHEWFITNHQYELPNQNGRVYNILEDPTQKGHFRRVSFPDGNNRLKPALNTIVINVACVTWSQTYSDYVYHALGMEPRATGSLAIFVGNKSSCNHSETILSPFQQDANQEILEMSTELLCALEVVDRLKYIMASFKFRHRSELACVVIKSSSERFVSTMTEWLAKASGDHWLTEDGKDVWEYTAYKRLHRDIAEYVLNGVKIYFMCVEEVDNEVAIGMAEKELVWHCGNLGGEKED